jgi:ADP-ribose pyrophosphatase YjhB (NUDIX family)
MFKYCPACASQNVRFDNKNKIHCPDCGFTYYHAVAAATGCVIRSREQVMLLVRGKEPAKGKLDLPGGFVDPGEGAIEGLRREIKEELGISLPEETEFTLFASFPNVYPYRNITYNTCDLFFSVYLPDLKEEDLILEEAEIAGVRFVDPADVNLDDLAFDSTKRAVQAYIRAFVT